MLKLLKSKQVIEFQLKRQDQKIQGRNSIKQEEHKLKIPDYFFLAFPWLSKLCSTKVQHPTPDECLVTFLTKTPVHLAQPKLHCSAEHEDPLPRLCSEKTQQSHRDRSCTKVAYLFWWPMGQGQAQPGEASVRCLTSFFSKRVPPKRTRRGVTSGANQRPSIHPSFLSIHDKGQKQMNQQDSCPGCDVKCKVERGRSSPREFLGRGDLNREGRLLRKQELHQQKETMS